MRIFGNLLDPPLPESLAVCLRRVWICFCCRQTISTSRRNKMLINWTNFALQWDFFTYILAQAAKALLPGIIFWIEILHEATPHTHVQLILFSLFAISLRLHTCIRWNDWKFSPFKHIIDIIFFLCVWRRHRIVLIKYIYVFICRRKRILFLHSRSIHSVLWFYKMLNTGLHQKPSVWYINNVWATKLHWISLLCIVVCVCAGWVRIFKHNPEC